MRLKDEILIYGAKTLCYAEEAKYRKDLLTVKKDEMCFWRAEYLCEHHAPLGSSILDQK